jgi:hypothetical protein
LHEDSLSHLAMLLFAFLEAMRILGKFLKLTNESKSSCNVIRIAMYASYTQHMKVVKYLWCI